MARGRWLAIVLLVLLARSAGGQEPRLPDGAPAEGVITSDRGVRYPLEATGAGILTVAVRAGEDVVIELRDPWEQVLASSDRDVGEDPGAEQDAFTVPRAGSYVVVVRPWSGRAQGTPFRIVSRFIPFPSLERPRDPDGDPGSAVPLTADSPRSDDLDPRSDDRVDWFRFDAPGRGILTCETEGADGDLVLEAFQGSDFEAAVARSDQDLDTLAHEVVAIEAAAGETYYFRVVERAGAAARYRVEVAFQPR